MIKKLAITHTFDKTTYVILRRRLNGNVYNNSAKAEEALGTWDKARKTECAVTLENKGGRYYTKEFPAGCDDGVWDAFYFLQLGGEIELTDRLLYIEKFINGAASIAERSMLAAGHTTNKTVYALIRSQDNAYIWDEVDEALEAIGTWDDTRAGQCAYPLDDKGGGYYTKAFPAGITAAGTYHIQYNDKLGAEYDTDDRLIGRDKVMWFGSTESDEVVPTGPRGKAMVNLRNLIAECESWQAWTGAADAEAAKAYMSITACYVGESGEFVKPLCLILRTENDNDVSIAVDSNAVSGDLEVRFDDVIPVDYTEEPGNGELYFLNKVEAVLAEMWELSRQAGKFAINDIQLLEGPARYEEKTGVFINVIRLQIGWGIKGE